MAAAAAVGLSPHNGIMFQDYLQKLSYQRGSGGASAATSGGYDVAAAAAAAAAYGNSNGGGSGGNGGTVAPQPYRFNPPNTQYTSYPTQVHDPHGTTTPATLLPTSAATAAAASASLAVPVPQPSSGSTASTTSSKFKYDAGDIDGQDKVSANDWYFRANRYEQGCYSIQPTIYAIQYVCLN